MSEMNGQELAKKDFMLKSWIGESGQLLAMGLAVCYLCGFVIVNSYLGKFGIKDYDAFKTEYIVAGILFFSVIGLWGFFVGRHLSMLDKRSNLAMERYDSLGGKSKYWKILGFITPVLDLASNFVVLTILSAIIFLTYSSQPIFLIFGFMGMVTFSVYSLETSAASKHTSKWTYALVSVFDLIAVVLFFFLLDEQLLQFVTFFGTITLVMALYADAVKYIGDTKYFLLIYLLVTVILIGSGTTFGKNFYEQIRPSLGGGKPAIVRLVINESETPEFLKNELKITHGVSEKYLLLDQSEKEFYFRPQNEAVHKTIRISRDLIKAVIYEEENTKNQSGESAPPNLNKGP